MWKPILKKIIELLCLKKEKKGGVENFLCRAGLNHDLLPLPYPPPWTLHMLFWKPLSSSWAVKSAGLHGPGDLACLYLDPPRVLHLHTPLQPCWSLGLLLGHLQKHTITIIVLTVPSLLSWDEFHASQISLPSLLAHFDGPYPHSATA